MKSAFEIIQTSSGHPSLRIDGKYIHSRMDPQREAQRSIQGLKENVSCVLVYGLGLGYLPEALIQHFALSALEDWQIIILEADTALVDIAVASRNLQATLSHRHVYLIGPDNEDKLASLLPRQASLVQTFVNQNLFSRHQKWYEKQKKLIDLVWTREKTNRATKAKFAQRWVSNTVQNAGLVAKLPGVRWLYNLFKGEDILLIAAGPSLDSQLALLPRLRERSVLVAVDTALSSCMRVNCIPDFVLAVDPQYWNSRHVDYVDTGLCTLIGEVALWPSLFRRPWARAFLFSSLFPLGSYLERLIDYKGELAAGGSVATTAWDFCRLLGAKRIIALGLDLAYPRGQTHSKGARFEEVGQQVSQRLAPFESANFKTLHSPLMQKVRSQRGESLYSDKRMLVYAQWFERAFEEPKSTPTLSLGGEGLALKGLGTMNPADILALDKTRLNIDKKKDQLYAKIDSNWKFQAAQRQTALETSLKRLIESLKELAEACTKAASLCKKAYFAQKASQDPDFSAKNTEDLVKQAFTASDACEELTKSPIAKEVAAFLFPSTEELQELVGEETDKLAYHLRYLQNLWQELGKSAMWHQRILKKFKYSPMHVDTLYKWQ